MMRYYLRVFWFGFHFCNGNTGEILLRFAPRCKRSFYLAKGGWRD